MEMVQEQNLVSVQGPGANTLQVMLKEIQKHAFKISAEKNRSSGLLCNYH